MEQPLLYCRYRNGLRDIAAWCQRPRKGAPRVEWVWGILGQASLPTPIPSALEARGLMEVMDGLTDIVDRRSPSSTTSGMTSLEEEELFHTSNGSTLLTGINFQSLSKEGLLSGTQELLSSPQTEMSPRSILKQEVTYGVLLKANYQDLQVYQRLPLGRPCSFVGCARRVTWSRG